jgi:hypothetical protein
MADLVGFFPPLFIALLLNIAGSFISTLTSFHSNYYLRCLGNIFGSLLECISLNYASPQIVSPLCALVVAWTVILNYKEVTNLKIVQALLIMLGIAFCFSELRTNVREESTLVYNGRVQVMLFIGASLIVGSGGLFREQPKLNAPIIGGFTNVTLKLLINAFVSNHPFWPYLLFYFALFGCVQLITLNINIDRFGAPAYNPIYISTLIISIIIVNSFVFEELISVDFIIGVILICSATLFL